MFKWVRSNDIWFVPLIISITIWLLPHTWSLLNLGKKSSSRKSNAKRNSIEVPPIPYSKTKTYTLGNSPRKLNLHPLPKLET